jgi:plastocyanin
MENRMTPYQRALATVPLLFLMIACSGGGNATSPTTSGGTYGGGSAPASPGTNEVLATTGNLFNPTSLTVVKGTTVSFTFQATTHNVTFDGRAGAPTNISNTASQTVTRNFATAGTFPYQCTIHSGMTGTVVVN